MFHPDAIREIKEHAERVYPEESCGIVSGGKYFECCNVHEDPLSHFEIHDEEYAIYEERDAGVDAIVHSHPDGFDCPTKDDMTAQIASAVSWGITRVVKGKAQNPFFWGDSLPIAPLIGRTFRMGVHDCYALVRDWFRIEKGIVLDAFPRDPIWWEKGQNILADNFDRIGFEEIPPMSPQPGDCMMGKIKGPVENHCAVYLGDGLMLHHLAGRLSRREPIGPWMKYATRFFRLKEKR